MNTQASGIEQLLLHAAWLRRFAGALLRDGDDVDDLVQNTFVAAWQHPPAEDSKPRSWLARIAQNRANDHRRGEKRRQARNTSAAEVFPGEVPGPEQLMGDLEIHRMVAEVVSALEEPYRQTIFLRYYEGTSAAEIATRLGVPAGTVRWRLKEGLDRVRRALDTRCGGNRRRWVIALAPLVARPTAPASASSSSALVIGGLLTVAVGLLLTWALLEERRNAAELPGGARLEETGPGSLSGTTGAAARSPSPPRFAARPAPAVGSSTTGEPTAGDAETIARHMLAAVAAGSYDDFLVFADDPLKAHFDKETMKLLSDELASGLERGFTLVPLGSLRQEESQTHLWRLELRDGGDDHLVRLSVKDGKAGGFWIE